MDLDFFKVQIIDNILIADFDNSKSANSFSFECAKELLEIIKAIKKKKHIGFVFTSTQRTFCSGGNLSDYAKLKSKKPGIEVNKKITEILNTLEKAPFPTVCCVSGDCFGGGIELTSAFDHVLATPHVLFGFWQRKIGLSLGWGGGARLLKRVSLKNLLNLIYQTKCFSSYSAKSVGLIDAVHTKESILGKACEYIKQQRDLPQIPFEKIKISQLKNEQKLFESLWHNVEHQRLLSKFR